MNGIQISIIMGVYNQKAFDQLDMAVNSILRQTFQAFEFLVYDDGSDGNVADKLEEYKDDVCFTEKKIMDWLLD